MNPTEDKKLRVWYGDRVPMENITYIDVNNVDEALLVIKALTERDLNDDRVTDNIMGLEKLNNGEWEEFYDDDGRDITEIES